MDLHGPIVVGKQELADCLLGFTAYCRDYKAGEPRFDG